MKRLLLTVLVPILISACGGHVQLGSTDGTADASPVDAGSDVSDAGPDVPNDECQTPAGTWRATSTVGAEYGNGAFASTWTGDEVLFFGFWSSVGGGRGGRYRPSNDSWSAMPLPEGLFDITGAFYVFHYASAWTGSSWLLWGVDQQRGASFIPSTGTWGPITALGAPTPRYDEVGVWTGDGLFVWGGTNDDVGPLGDGAIYHPATDSWTTVSPSFAPSARSSPVGAWTGNSVIVWGGYDDLSKPQNTDAAIYDPSTDVWRPMNTDGAPPLLAAYQAVWTGKELLVWASYCWTDEALCEGGRGFTALYSPDSDQWRYAASGGPVQNRLGASVTWTGTRLIVWGGMDRDDPTLSYGDGAMYDPEGDSWTPIPENPCAPSPRSGHLAVWTDSGLVIWGGEEAVSQPGVKSGAIFVPAD